jgi:hypothetical protein
MIAAPPASIITQAPHASHRAPAKVDHFGGRRIYQAQACHSAVPS